MNRFNQPSQPELDLLLPAYVLGALDAETMQAIEAYIRSQHDFLNRLQKLEEKAALLTHIAKPITPSPNLRRTILMIARLDAPQETISTTLPPMISSAIQPYTQPHHGNGGNSHQNGQNGVTYAIAPYRATQASVVKRSINPNAAANSPVARQRRLTLRLWQLAATMALVTLLTVAAIGILLSQQLQETKNNGDSKVATLLVTNNQLLLEQELLRGQNHVLENQQQQLSTQFAQTQQQLNIITSAESASALRSVNGNGSSRAMIYLTGRNAVIAASDFKPLPSDQTYQLWWLDSKGLSQPVAVFTVQENETLAWREFSLPNAALDYSEIAISIEQIGGSAQPSSLIMRSIR